MDVLSKAYTKLWEIKEGISATDTIYNIFHKIY